MAMYRCRRSNTTEMIKRILLTLYMVGKCFTFSVIEISESLNRELLLSALLQFLHFSFMAIKSFLSFSLRLTATMNLFVGRASVGGLSFSLDG